LVPSSSRPDVLRSTVVKAHTDVTIRGQQTAHYHTGACSSPGKQL